MSETKYDLMFFMEFDIPRFNPTAMSAAAMEPHSKGLWTYYSGAQALKDRATELEQQLSNSISKDELRGLVEELRGIENRDNNPIDQHLVGASLGAGMAADKLNKLLEGSENG